MVYYLIICRSLTYAQRTAAILERAGITARVLRAPRSIAGEGCSHSVRVAERHLSRGLVLLHRANLNPKQIYMTEADGSYREVDL